MGKLVPPARVSRDLDDVEAMDAWLRRELPWAYEIGLSPRTSSGEPGYVSGGGVSDPTGDVVVDLRLARLRQAYRNAVKEISNARAAYQRAIVELQNASLK